MLSEAVRIRALDSAQILVEGSRKAACGKCSVRSGCGHHLLGPDRELLVLERSQLSLEGGAPAVGATLTLKLPVGMLTKLALLFYCMPLALLLLFTLVASLLAANEVLVVCAGLAGLLLGLSLLPGLQPALSKQLTCSLAPSGERGRKTFPESEDES